MKKEKLVTSLELSKKLKDFKIPQKSYFWWINPFKKYGWRLCDFTEWDFNNHHEYCSAFTSVELGEFLPQIIDLEGSDFYLVWTPDLLAYGRYGFEITEYEVKIPEDADTETNARAKMLIQLIKNDLVNTEALTDNK